MGPPATKWSRGTASVMQVNSLSGHAFVLSKLQPPLMAMPGVGAGAAEALAEGAAVADGTAEGDGAAEAEAGAGGVEGRCVGAGVATDDGTGVWPHAATDAAMASARSRPQVRMGASYAPAADGRNPVAQVRDALCMTATDRWVAALPGREVVDLEHAGRARPYLLQVPSPSLRAASMSLVLELHGRGISPERFDAMTGFGELAASEGFALALPAAIGELWNDGRDAEREATPAAPDDVGYLSAVVADATSRLGIEPGRTFVVGMSNGATMAARLVLEGAGQIAAFAQVAGTAAASISDGRPARPTPILSIHGSADPFAPEDSGDRRGVRARLVFRHPAGPSVRIDAWARHWVQINGTADAPTATRVADGAQARTWRGATPDSVVSFIRVDGGGHTWPGSRFALPRLLFGRTSTAFDATALIWEFFAARGA